MTTLVLDRADLELRRDGAAIALFENGERRGTVPLALLERVVIQGSVQVDTALLGRLAEAGIAAVFLSGRQSRRLGVLLGGNHSDASIRLAQCQLALDPAWCERWSRRLVSRKIRSQAKALHAALALRPDCRKALHDALGTIEEAMHTLAGQNVSVATVRGVEGAAAAAYFRAFTALFPESLGFGGRNRRPPRDPVNACLSLGYTMLHFDTVRACHIAGLDPLIGFYHRPAFGRESMACDLVEPLRVQVDTWVWASFRTRMWRAESFSFDRGACLLGKQGRARFYVAWESLAARLRRRLRRECAVLARALRHRGEPLLEAAGADAD